MAEGKRDFKKRLQGFTSKALKATIKGILFYGIYFVLSIFLAPISEIVPSFQQTIEIFVIVYIFLMVIGELTSGTIFHHFFNAAKALFVILYLIFSLKGGILSMTVQNVNLIVDLRLFLVVAMLLGLLGFAKSVLQAINFMSEKAEHVHF
ncbi:hypothetical protein KAU55_04020 [Candidatus Bathyarchaeota archaeon]|nr:hypothetical protein [Candidatus Bathyarchaeota archaeon]